jgi:hypothetical protein
MAESTKGPRDENWRSVSQERERTPSEFEARYPYKNGYISLPVEVGELPDTVSVGGERLQKRSSFHVSLVYVKNIIAQHPHLEREVLACFNDFVKENDISFVEYTGEFRLAQKDDKKTLAALCQVSSLEKFPEFLEQRLGIKVSPQPTHVTLYTLQPDAGIDLYSMEEMEASSAPVATPEGMFRLIVVLH